MIQSIRTKLRALLTDLLRVLAMPLATSVPALTLRVVKEKPAIKAAVDHGPLASSSADSERGINSSTAAHRESAEWAEKFLAFETPDDSIRVKWGETGILRESDAKSSSPVAMPEAPDAFYSVDPCFMTAMIEASQTTSTEKSRFAMDCIRLRGADGQIAACDSYQAFTQAGFRFPWSDDVLVVSSGALVSPDFHQAQYVEIGRTDCWLFIRLPHQTLALSIEKERQFPHLDPLIPTDSSKATTLHVSPCDARLLATFIPRLPGVRAHSAPVTVDLSGVVAIRAADEDAYNAVELVLDYSSYVGNGLRLQTERSYLMRAIQLGFRDIYLRNAEVPAFCHDHNRTYQWALLGEEGSIATSEGMSKIHSLNNRPVSLSISDTATERIESSTGRHRPT